MHSREKEGLVLEFFTYIMLRNVTLKQ